MLCLSLLPFAVVEQADGLLAGGAPVLAADALETTPVGGLQNTSASSEIVAVSGPGFSKAVRVTLRKRASETNATQMTVPTAEPVRKGDVLLAQVWVRGRAADGRPGRIELLFEKSSSPWNKSLFVPVVAKAKPEEWRRFLVPFASAGDYGKGEAMVSIRFATAVQQVEVGGLSVLNFGKTRNLEEMLDACFAENKLGNAALTLDLKKPRQTMLGLGGNFCQPRYGRTEPLDVNGKYCLDHLQVANARIGLPLNFWNPQPGVYKDDAQARASFLALQEMKRRGIPTVVSVWVGPEWMVGPDRMGTVLRPEMVDPCIDSIAEYLKTAKEKYGAEPEYFSFNEPDLGVNFKFEPPEFIDFIRRAGAKFKKMGLKTKFLVVDSANAAGLKPLAVPLLEDKSIAEYLGPISFHCWDVLGAPDELYRGIAELGRRYKKPVWCLEAGYDAQLWQKPNPWPTWDNALNIAIAYAKTVRLSEASLMSYWTYQNNYPLVEEASGKPYPAFHVIKQMEGVLGAGWKVVEASADTEDIQYVATAKGGSPAVLIVNPIGAGTLTIKGFPPKQRADVFVSDKSAQGRLAKTATADASGKLTLALPARSVVTVIGR